MPRRCRQGGPGYSSAVMMVPTCSPLRARVMLPGMSALMIWISPGPNGRSGHHLQDLALDDQLVQKSRAISWETVIRGMNSARGFFLGSSV